MGECFRVIKKNGNLEEFDANKIVTAIEKSADRVNKHLTEIQKYLVIQYVLERMKEDTPVSKMHMLVEQALDSVDEQVARSYREYRNYKQDFNTIFEKIIKDGEIILSSEDKENANSDTKIVATKRSLMAKMLGDEIYKKTFLKADEYEAIHDGYIYIHDRKDRYFQTYNCCLANIFDVMKDGFKLAETWYKEPKRIKSAFSVARDIIMSMSANQYGGYTVPRFDQGMAKYAKLSYEEYYQEYLDICAEIDPNALEYDNQVYNKANKYAMTKCQKDIEQGVQELEYCLNTLASSRGDFPFVTFTFGLGTSIFEKMISSSLMKVRKNGQGPSNVIMMFPKLVFLYDANLHGEGKENYDLFLEGIDCSKNVMYPDWLSLTGDGYVADIYKKYGQVISPMGCRAYLSPYYPKGGWFPEGDETPIYEGRSNLGAISFNLPMIYMKSKNENIPFYKVLDIYLEMARNIHIRTYKQLCKVKASTNPLAFTQGGLLNGYLNPNDNIEPVIKSSTLSFGITALHELQLLYNGKSLYEDGDFSYEVLKYINEKVADFKKEDNLGYAIYSTPAESYQYTQRNQFVNKYGIIEGVSDKLYFNNSFHMAVSENITPIEKQDAEYRFFHLSNGGHIQYTRFTNDRNVEAFKTLILRAMNKGYYYGCNLERDVCESCGERFIDTNNTINECPKCHSTHIIKTNRVCGYLSYTRTSDGNTRMNKGLLANIEARRSM